MINIFHLCCKPIFTAFLILSNCVHTSQIKLSFWSFRVSRCLFIRKWNLFKQVVLADRKKLTPPLSPAPIQIVASKQTPTPKTNTQPPVANGVTVSRQHQVPTPIRQMVSPIPPSLLPQTPIPFNDLPTTGIRPSVSHFFFEICSYECYPSSVFLDNFKF